MQRFDKFDLVKLAMPCVYAYADMRGKLAYIGYSARGIHRFGVPFRLNEVSKVYVTWVETEKIAQQVERLLIKLCNPPWNKRVNFYTNKGEIGRDGVYTRKDRPGNFYASLVVNGIRKQRKLPVLTLEEAISFRNKILRNEVENFI